VILDCHFENSRDHAVVVAAELQGLVAIVCDAGELGCKAARDKAAAAQHDQALRDQSQGQQGAYGDWNHRPAALDRKIQQRIDLQRAGVGRGRRCGRCLPEHETQSCDDIHDQTSV
jgi:hypothetical protein